MSGWATCSVCPPNNGKRRRPSAEPSHRHAPQLLPELISRHAQQQPDAIAVQCAGESLTYAELERQANRLAQCLIAHGAGRKW